MPVNWGAGQGGVRQEVTRRGWKTAGRAARLHTCPSITEIIACRKTGTPYLPLRMGASLRQSPREGPAGGPKMRLRRRTGHRGLARTVSNRASARTAIREESEGE